jgi:hypothetical protein
MIKVREERTLLVIFIVYRTYEEYKSIIKAIHI